MVFFTHSGIRISCRGLLSKGCGASSSPQMSPAAGGGDWEWRNGSVAETVAVVRRKRRRRLGESRKAKVESGRRWTVDGGRWTVDGGRWTVDGRVSGQWSRQRGAGC